MVTRHAMVNYLTSSTQALHAEDQRLNRMLRRVADSGQVGPEELEAIVDAQRTTIRVFANSLLMLSSYVEGVPSRPHRLLSRVKAAVKAAGL